eukprot:gene8508-1522_t
MGSSTFTPPPSPLVVATFMGPSPIPRPSAIPSCPVYSVAFRPGGGAVASGSGDASVKVWDPTDGNVFVDFRNHTRVSRRYPRPCSHSADLQNIRVMPTLSLPLDVLGVAWDPSGSRLASASRDVTVKVWLYPAGQVLLTYTGHIGRVTSVAWSPDGNSILTGSLDGTAKVWNPATGLTTLDFGNHTGPVNGVAWAPSGQKVASCSEDGHVKVLHMSHRLLHLVYSIPACPLALLMRNFSPMPGAVKAVSWRPAGAHGAAGDLIASGGADSKAMVWRHDSGEVLAVAWSPDGARLATSSGDRTAKVWDAVSAELQVDLQGHKSDVLCVAWDSDGNELASGGGELGRLIWDRTVKIWQTSCPANAPNSVPFLGPNSPPNDDTALSPEPDDQGPPVKPTGGTSSSSSGVLTAPFHDLTFASPVIIHCCFVMSLMATFCTLADLPAPPLSEATPEPAPVVPSDPAAQILGQGAIIAIVPSIVTTAVCAAAAFTAAVVGLRVYSNFRTSPNRMRDRLLDTLEVQITRDSPKNDATCPDSPEPGTASATQDCST